MKKCLYLVAGVFFTAAWLPAETIDSVSFNPSRLGRYENLKISDTLNSKGGIEAQAVTVQAAGTIDFENNRNYQFDTTTVESSLYMPYTRFVAGTLNSQGTAAFEDETSSVTSTINNLNNTSVRVRANVLRLGNVSIDGGGVAAVDYDGNPSSGFILGNNKIPQPGKSCTGLKWTPIKTEEGLYQVLAFNKCPSLELNPCANVFCTSGTTLNTATCKCESNGSSCNKTCSSGQTLDEDTCTCVDDEEEAFPCLSTATFEKFKYTELGAFCDTPLNTPVLSCISTYTFQEASSACLGYIPRQGIPSGCAPGSVCEACRSNMDAKYYTNLACSGSNIWGLNVYSCFWGDETCTRYATNPPDLGLQ